MGIEGGRDNIRNYSLIVDNLGKWECCNWWCVGGVFR